MPRINEDEIRQAAERLLAKQSFRDLLQCLQAVPEHRRDAITESVIRDLLQRILYKVLEAGKIEWLNGGGGTSENVICWITDGERVEADFTQRRTITKIRRLAEQNPDDVIIHWQNNGSINCSFPVEYLAIRKPKRMNLTDEQRQLLRQRLEMTRTQNHVLTQ